MLFDLMRQPEFGFEQTLDALHAGMLTLTDLALTVRLGPGIDR